MSILRYSMATGLMLLALLAFLRVPPELNAFGMQLLPPLRAAQELQGDVSLRPLPWSERGRSYMLNACLDGQVEPSLALYPAEYRAQMAANCGELSARILQDSPSYGLSALVQAQSAAVLGPGTAFVTLLETAQDRAPNEGWMASWRVLTAVENGQPNTPGLIEIVLADAKVMGAHTRQMAFLASYYVRYPQWRNTISSAVGTLSEQQQKRFVTYVRQRMERS